jgi:RecA-family ATPase
VAEGARQQQWGPHAAAASDELTGLAYDRLLRDPPTRDWMVEGCFMKGTVGMVSGDGSIGKSLLMQQLATCAVLGRPWLGLAVKPGRALYLGCEDDGDEVHRRQWAINRSLNTPMEEVLDAGLDLIPRVGQDNVLVRLTRPEWRMMPTSLMDKLVWRCRHTSVRYVIVDTATQTFAGNQNDEMQVVAYINEFRRLALAIQGVVIFTKHPSMTGRALGTGESGNVAWNNSVRARLYLHQHKALGLVLDGMKANYGPKLKPMPLRWERGVFERVMPEPARDYSEAGGYDR